MTMTDDMTDLDWMLHAARAGRDDLPEALAQRMLADAAGVQASLTPRPVPGRDLHAHGAWRALLAALGGWRGMGGLATACAAGVWIGVAPPEFLPDPAQLVLGAQTETETLGFYDLADIISEDG
ncbi:hypothetical protein KBY23_12780 [Ruegeria pomeroyi]|nr:hypothetical protein [Ruegeria pomeroyi]